ncbi:MAG: HD-GYP domain-containing protein [Acidimicrobiia bacterium]
MGDPRVSVRSPLVPVVWALGSAAFAYLLMRETDISVLQVGIWAILLAEASLVSLPASSGNRLSLAIAVSAALPFVLTSNDSVDLAAAGAASAMGLLGTWMFRTLRSDAAQEVMAAVLRHGFGVAAYLVVFAGSVSLGENIPVLAGTDWLRLIAFSIAASLWFLIETSLWSFMVFGRDRLSRRYLWLLAVKDWPVVLSLLTTGALFGFAWSELGFWAIVIAGIPYGFAHVAFYRSQESRRTYGQTIRALSRIPEVAGLSPKGHSDRTSGMAIEVGQDLGMTPDEVTDLQYSALMHDIGRITLNEPSILKMGFTDEDIARWGAEIVAEAPYLSQVAALVRQQHQPYRRPGEERDLELPMASKIIKATSAYDHATMELGFSPLEALEVLHRGAAYDFDPDVVQAVRRVLERRKVVPA